MKSDCRFRSDGRAEGARPFSRSEKKPAIALEARLRDCGNVRTLGVRPNFSDYSPEEVRLIMEADKIYYPSTFYADMLEAMGRRIFPSSSNYRFAQDKIKQTAVFQMLNISHPRTRVFYGKRQKQKILDWFSYPFVAKVARGSAMGRGVFLVRSDEDLESYLSLGGPAYIQQYLPIDRDMRIVVIGDRVAHAYWRIAATGQFKSNVAAGGRVSFRQIPDGALEFALGVARACGWNDVGMDVCLCDGRFYVIEGNMKYGREGFRQAGIDFSRMMEAMIENGDI